MYHDLATDYTLNAVSESFSKVRYKFYELSILKIVLKVQDSILYIGSEVTGAKNSSLGIILDEQLLMLFSDITMSSDDLAAQLYESFIGSPNFPPAKNVMATKLHNLIMKLVQVIQVLFTNVMKVEDFIPGDFCILALIMIVFRFLAFELGFIILWL